MSDSGRFSTWTIEGWMDGIEAMPKYLALFASDPYAVLDPLTVEVVGGAYARHASTWDRVSTFALQLNASVPFLGLPPGAVVAAVGAMTAPTNGSLIFRSMIVDEAGLPAPKSFPTGGAYVLAAGQYVVGIDVPVGP